MEHHCLAGSKDGGHSIDGIKKTMARNDILHTERTYCEQGELFNATLIKKGNPNAIGLKKGLDPMKYGGYSSPKTSAFAFIEFDGKKDGKIISLRFPYISLILLQGSQNISKII